MSKKRALGRGLSALLEDVETDITTGTSTESTSRVLGSVAMLPMNQIEANPFQPRTVFDETSLMELVQSIRELGIIQPVTVRKIGYDKFQLISGERRFRASHIAGLTEIPVFIRIANDQAMLEMALVENIQRKNLDAIEIAISYQRLMEECNLTQEALSERVGKKRATISNYLRLLNLPPEIQLGIRESKISMGHARGLLAFDSEEKMIKAYQKILSEDWSVRQVEQVAKEDKGSPKPKSKQIPLSFEYQKIKSDLTDLFGTKVDLKRDQKGKGKIEISFQSQDDLQRIIDKLEF
ncbi:ParB/RepB/Spo0J family partition protein [Cryomorpha ignava]|uniref:ParB/RepB/Spo0J family partition protein n=1 Tax=Cryomorpha ignava TaxID=101383 RepID=A0A7K3WUX2_9FLAO|nr:ParB/RepB/Spo0J family partition protein [Cryomorpha ignava]NEN25483.1 ParB/RepB/Spo0J family partition protein [Cryomorpha ignava]